MRKADYTILTQVIRTVREHSMPHGRKSPEAVIAAENIAREFARLASVDKTAFLKACGIE